MNENNISIKKIAELAGTSIATVSRVINQNGRYSKETEEKIHQIMKEYNYQPNYLAKALRENKTNLIGVIVPDITNMFFAKVYRAIELQLYEYGYLPVLCDTNEDDELEQKYIENLNHLRFAGLICLNGAKLSLPDNLPILYADRYPKGEDLDPKNEHIHFVGSDNYKGGYLAAKALINAGRKNICVIYHGKAITTIKERYNGFEDALKKHGIQLNENAVYSLNDITYQSGYEYTEKLITSGVECDAIFYTSDVLAIGGVNYLNNCGKSVPKDISVVGFDDIPLSAYANLSTIHQHTSIIGSTAAKTIIDMVNGIEVEKMQLLNVKLIERNTI